MCGRLDNDFYLLAKYFDHFSRKSYPEIEPQRLLHNLPIIETNRRTDKPMSKYIKDKYKNVTAISFKAYDNDLIINFSGFESEEDVNDFCEFVFNKIHMKSNFGEKPPTVH